MKIISPLKKSDFIVRELHHFHGKFDSVTSLKLKLMDEFGELVPATTDFQIGYFRGKQSTKYWIMCQEDLDMIHCEKETKHLTCYGVMEGVLIH